MLVLNCFQMSFDCWFCCVYDLIGLLVWMLVCLFCSLCCLIESFCFFWFDGIKNWAIDLSLWYFHYRFWTLIQTSYWQYFDAIQLLVGNNWMLPWNETMPELIHLVNLKNWPTILNDSIWDDWWYICVMFEFLEVVCVRVLVVWLDLIDPLNFLFMC